MQRLRVLRKQREQGGVGVCAGQHRRGGRHQAHVARGEVLRQVHHAPRQRDGREKRQAPSVGLVLDKVEQLHAWRLQQHLHHGELRGRYEHQRIQPAGQERHGSGRFFQVRELHVGRLHAIRLEQPVHEVGHAAAGGAHVHPQPLELRHAAEPPCCACCAGWEGSTRLGTGLRGRRAVEHPDRFHEKAAERDQFVGIIGLARCRAALDEGHIGLAVAQQLQVGRRPLAGQQHHLDAIGRQGFLVALAELRISALGGPGGHRHRLGRVGVEPPVSQRQQSQAQEGERSGGSEQVAQ